MGSKVVVKPIDATMGWFKLVLPPYIDPHNTVADEDLLKQWFASRYLRELVQNTPLTNASVVSLSVLYRPRCRSTKTRPKTLFNQGMILILANVTTVALLWRLTG